MIQIITVIHIIVCVVLVLVVLLQQGKKDGMGAAFGGGSQSVFGARGAETFLEKLTKILAVVFMCTSLSLVYFSSKESTGSILSNENAPVTEPAPGVSPNTDGTPVVPPATTEGSTPAESAPATEAVPAEPAKN